MRGCPRFAPVFLITALLAAGRAEAAVTVVGGDLAESCSKAAKASRSDQLALETCNKALEMQTLTARDLAGTLVNRGVILMDQKAWAAAQRDFQAAVQTDPALGEAHVNLGAALIVQRRFREGVEEIDRGLALGAEEPEKAYFNRALARERMGDITGAYLDFRKAAELAPAWPAPKAELTRFTVHRTAGSDGA